MIILLSLNFVLDFGSLNLILKRSKMSVTEACCKLPPVTSDYTPQGTVSKVGDLDVYVTKEKNDKTLICVYDIFGFHPVTQQVADKLSSAGFRVIMPDFFRGKPFSLANFPPKDWQELQDFLAERGTWEKTVKTDLLNVLSHYKEKEGINSVGIYGFCWGGKTSLTASVEIESIKAAALIHPAFWKTEDAETVTKPLLLMPSKDEDDMTPFYEIVKKKLGADKAEHHRFDDMHHGFCAARGDLSKEDNRKRVDEALDLLKNFFTKHVS